MQTFCRLLIFVCVLSFETNASLEKSVNTQTVLKNALITDPDSTGLAFTTIDGKTSYKAYKNYTAESIYLVELQLPSLIDYQVNTLNRDSQLHSKETKEAKEIYAKALLQHQNLLSQQQQTFQQSALQKGLINQVEHKYTRLINMVQVQASHSQAQKLKQLPQVKRVSKQKVYTKSVTESVGIVRAPEIWSLEDAAGRLVQGSDIDIAVIDTGIDYTHPALGGCLGTGCKVADGYDFVNEDNDPMDGDGHGTHVAGIIAGYSETFSGVAPAARLHAYKALDDFGSGFDTDIIEALEKAMDPDGDPSTDDQLDIVNMSLGGSGDNQDPLSVAVNNAVSAGVIVVVAAGNSGSYGTIARTSPAAAQQAITVAASDKDDILAPYSSKGPMHGAGYLKPEITAPGSGINSTFLDGSYIAFDGTSMAAPHVAGAVALLKQLHPDRTPAQIKSMLSSGAVTLFEDAITEGAGRLDVVASNETSVIADVAGVDFGRIDQDTGTWSTDVTIRLTNLSNAIQTISAISADGLPENMMLSLPDANIELPAQSSVAFNVGVSVDEVTQLPAMEDASLSYFGVLNLITSANALRLPITVERSLKLTVRNNAPIAADITLSNSDPEAGNLSLYAFIPENEDVELFMLAGNFSGNAVYSFSEAVNFPHAENLPPDSMVWSHEIIDVDTGQTNEIELTLETIDTFQGINRLTEGGAELLKGQDFTLWAADSMITYGNGNSTSLSLTGNQDIFIGVGNIQQDSVISYDTAITPRQNAEGVNERIFAHYESENGVKESVLIDANLDEAHPMTILFDEKFHSEQHKQSFAFNSRSFLRFSSLIDSENYQWNLRWLDGYQNNGAIELATIQFDQQNFAIDTIASTGLLNVSEAGDMQKVDINNTSFVSADTQTLHVDGNHTFWQPLLFVNDEQIRNGTFLFNRNFEGAYVVDKLGNYYNVGANIQLSWLCDQTEISRVSIRTNQPLPQIPTEPCDNASMQIEFDNQLGQSSFTSTLQHYFSDSNAIYVPALYEVRLVQNGNTVVGQTLDKIDPKIRLVVETYLIDFMTVEFKLDDGDWFSLTKAVEPIENAVEQFSTDASAAVVSLPQISGEHVASLRISIDDGFSRTVQTLNGFSKFGITPNGDADDDGLINGDDSDNDNDGHNNEDDAFPFNSSEWLDSDNDGLGNNADLDDDNDAAPDTEDAFPLDPNEWIDSDNDGIGNNSDTDDDNDGVADDDDAFPFDAQESIDTDNDGVGNNADTDDDNDGTPDNSDAYPLDASRSVAPVQPDTNSGGGGTTGIITIILLNLCILRRNQTKESFNQIGS